MEWVVDCKGEKVFKCKQNTCKDDVFIDAIH